MSLTDAKKISPGRPRNPGLESRVLKATVDQLGALGYARMSLESIAAETGVSKPALYRRWSGKADLATAAIATLRVKEPAVDTGTTVGDLTGILSNFRKSLLRPNGMALIGTVLSEEAHTPNLLKLFRERLVAPRRAMLRTVLLRARKNGELKPKADIEAAIQMMVGALYAHYLAGPAIPPRFIAAVVGIAWRGLSRA